MPSAPRSIDELDKIVDCGKSKLEFLSTEYDIQAIPSQSTLTRVFAMINPRWLGLYIVGILKTMIDGKAIRSTDAIKVLKK